MHSKNFPSPDNQTYDDHTFSRFLNLPVNRWTMRVSVLVWSGHLVTLCWHPIYSSRLKELTFPNLKKWKLVINSLLKMQYLKRDPISLFSIKLQWGPNKFYQYRARFDVKYLNIDLSICFEGVYLLQFIIEIMDFVIHLNNLQVLFY